MNKRLQFGRASSILVSLPAVALWLILCVAAAVGDLLVLSAAFAFLFLLSGAAFLWGARSIRHVTLEVDFSRTRLYPDMETTFSYTVKNDKLLPLIWLELSQGIPERDCLTPDETFERYACLSGEAQGRESTPDTADRPAPDAYRRTFSFVMGHETLTLRSVWTARRRGVYRMDRLMLRSGDGFGLSQVEAPCPPSKLPQVLVYPRSVPVDISLFLQEQWRQSAGSAGYQEDMAVLRGLRPYQPSDSWKRINWRMAARTQELKVNFYETIQPLSALFVLDGESFCGLSTDYAELEQALELLGSVIARLFRRGVTCGLALPASRRYSAVTLPPVEGRSAAELLGLLAGYDCLAQHLFAENGDRLEQCAPSRFDERAVLTAASEAGRVYLITCAPDGPVHGLVGRLGATRVTVFAAAGVASSADPDLRVVPLRRLAKGAAV